MDTTNSFDSDRSLAHEMLRWFLINLAASGGMMLGIYGVLFGIGQVLTKREKSEQLNDN